MRFKTRLYGMPHTVTIRAHYMSTCTHVHVLMYIFAPTVHLEVCQVRGKPIAGLGVEGPLQRGQGRPEAQLTTHDENTRQNVRLACMRGDMNDTDILFNSRCACFLNLFPHIRHATWSCIWHTGGGYTALLYEATPPPPPPPHPPPLLPHLP